jgi:Protein of unknown function (DUF3168)
MIEVGIVALLKADSALAGLIAGRIYPVVLPPETTAYPCLTYQVITSSSDITIDRTKASHKIIQFDAFSGPTPASSSGSYLDCKSVLSAVGAVLDGYHGLLTDGTRVLFAQSTIEIDNFENDSRVYRCLCEYEFFYVN